MPASSVSTELLFQPPSRSEPESFQWLYYYLTSRWSHWFPFLCEYVSVCLFKFPKVNVASQVTQWWRICLPSRRHMFDPWVRKIPWRRKWIATLVFSLGNFHGQRSLAGGCKESDMTSWLNNKVDAQSRKGKPFIGRKSQYNRTKG